LHFHPDVTKEDIKEKIITNHKLQITNYNYAPEFNKTIKSLVVEIPFKKELKVEINI